MTTRAPRTSQSRSGPRIHGNGSRWALLGLLVLGLASAGCGGDGRSSEDVAAVEAAVVALGTTQDVSCDELGTEDVGGVEVLVFTCGLQEEAEQTGEMREARRCYVLSDDGTLTEVTRELRDRGSCPVTSP